MSDDADLAAQLTQALKRAESAEAMVRNLKSRMRAMWEMCALVDRRRSDERDNYRDRYLRDGGEYHRGRHDECRVALSDLHHLTNGAYGEPLDKQPELERRNVREPV